MVPILGIFKSELEGNKQSILFFFLPHLAYVSCYYLICVGCVFSHVRVSITNMYESHGFQPFILEYKKKDQSTID